MKTSEKIGKIRNENSLTFLKKYDVINSGSRIREIQRFLKSSWFRLLSDLDGEKLIELMEGEST